MDTKRQEEHKIPQTPPSAYRDEYISDEDAGKKQEVLTAYLSGEWVWWTWTEPPACEGGHLTPSL